MKYLAFVLLICIVISCSFNVKNNEMKEASSVDSVSGKILIQYGFLEYVDSSKADSMKIELVESFNIYDENNYKIIHIDAEELSEFNFDFFLPQLNAILSKRNLSIEVEKTGDYEISNEIIINKQKIKLYTEEELELGTYWDSAPRNFFKRVNEILKQRNIEEEFYLLYGGNDLHAFLLTEKQFQIIAERYMDDTREIPYLP